MGSDRRHSGQYCDDVTAVGPPLVAPQTKTLIAREQDPTERAAWWGQLADRNPADLIFLDETSTPLTLSRCRARAPRSKRAIGRVPRGRWEAVTLLATLTVTGMGPSVQFPGALDRDAFATSVAEVLV